MERNRIVEELLSKPNELLKKKPFYRGCDMGYDHRSYTPKRINETIDVSLPRHRYNVVTQEMFMRELDPNCHDVLFDINVPSICVKLNDGTFADIKQKKMAIPFQKMIKNKQVLHLTGNPMQFTLLEKNPTDKQMSDFMMFKKYWQERNQDGMRNKMVDKQKSLGDAGLLYYFDYKGRIKSRILSYDDGYVLCPHNDKNGDRILETVYYMSNDVEHIDCYDDTYMYSFIKNVPDGKDIAIDEDFGGWTLVEMVAHGFNEIPLVTKRGDVAWNNVQDEIEMYEILINIFAIIQKRFGWGILYVRGKFSEKAQKVAGSVILNDTGYDTNGDAKFLTPPTPQGTIDTLQLIEENIQKGSGTTFMLPKDVKMSGDISGIAIMLAQSLDIENAMQGVIDWQNVADKMVRLFKYGLSKELVNSKENPTAITDFDNLKIGARFKVWKPLNDFEYNQMLATLKGSGIISQETATELSTESKPDELARLLKEAKEMLKTQQNPLSAESTAPEVNEPSVVTEKQDNDGQDNQTV